MLRHSFYEKEKDSAQFFLFGIMGFLLILSAVVTAVEPVQIPAGSIIIHNVSVVNTGKGTAFNVTLKEVYPEDVSFVSSSIAPVKGDNVFLIGNMNQGESFFFTISVLVKKSGSQEKFLNNNVSATFLSKKGEDNPPKIELLISAIFASPSLNQPEAQVVKSEREIDKSGNAVAKEAAPSASDKQKHLLPGKGGQPLSFEGVTRPEFSCGVSRDAGSVGVVASRANENSVIVPKGFELVVEPFSLDCTNGDVDLSLSVPSAFTELQALKFSKEQTSQLEFNETEWLMCGSQSLTNFTSEYLRRTVFVLNVTDLPLSSTASLLVSDKNNSLTVDNHRITLLRQQSKSSAQKSTQSNITLEAGAVNQSLALPSNPLLSIIGAPLQLSVKCASEKCVSESVLAEVLFSFSSNKLLDESSLGLFLLNGMNGMNGSSWEYVGGVRNGSGFLANISLSSSSSQPTILALMGTYCEGCVQAELVKKYSGTSRIAVIFVHGLTSRASKWSYILDEFKYTRQPEQFWMFNYPVVRKTDDNARALIDLLEQKQAEFDAVYFVGHSLGGFIVESALAQAAAANEKNPYAYTFLKKVRQALIVGAPHEGSPSAEVYLNLFKVFANKPDIIPVVNTNTDVVQEITKGKTFARAPNIEYVVLAGTKSYEFNAGLFKFSTNKLLHEVNDGITNVSGARKIGDSELNDFCSNYYELNVTHTELDDNPKARKIIGYVISKDISISKQARPSQALLGFTKYIKLTISNCSSQDSYALIGKSVPPNAAPVVLGCNCGNNVCGLDENETACPVDCSRSLFSEEEAFVKRVASYFLVLCIVLFGFLSWRSYHNKKQVLLLISAVCFVLAIISLVLIQAIG